jgi:hypothetical protein
MGPISRFFPLFSILALVGALFAQDPGDPLADLKRLRDDADAELVWKIAEGGDRAAAEGLVEAYDLMGSTWMRREIIRALPRFDGKSGAEKPALDHLFGVAQNTDDLILREESLEALAGATNLGKGYLARIVESPSADMVRVRAMELHTRVSDKSDHAWYLAFYEDRGGAAEGESKKPKRKRKSKKNDEEEAPKLVVHRLAQIRALAFEMIASSLEDRQVLGAFDEETHIEVRSAMLRDLERRGNKELGRMARELVESVALRGDMRAEAAEILARSEGARIADLFIDLGRKQAVTPEVLRTTMAELLAGLDDPKVDKLTAKLIGRGKPHEKRFALTATRGTKDEKVLKKIARGLKDKDPGVVILTLQVLGESKYEDAIKDMEKVLDKGKNEDVLTAAMKALSQVRSSDDEWRQRLEGFALGEHRLLRNASIRALGSERKLLDLFTITLAHDDWSTRLATLNALEMVRKAPVVGIIVERMQEEGGRMLRECADSLWRLTGEPYRLRTVAWKGWYEGNKDSIEIISSSKLARLEEEEETRRLKETSRVEFFGIRIESKSVIFILDISGSMLERLRSRYVGKTGETRIDHAKSELVKAIESLEEGALFNVVAFNGGVLPWKDGLSAATGSTRSECVEWVNKLGALGGTNLFDSLEQAFQDQDVDTIMILSDGEPTAGQMTEPSGIRREVLSWNEDRNVRIHTVAMGGSLKILEWLAEDSDGQHTRHD